MIKKAKHKRIYVEDPNFYRGHYRHSDLIDGDKRESEPKHDIMYRIRYGWIVNGSPRCFTVWFSKLGEAYKFWLSMVNEVEMIHIDPIRFHGKKDTMPDYFYYSLEELTMGVMWYKTVNKDSVFYKKMMWEDGCSEILRKDEI